MQEVFVISGVCYDESNCDATNYVAYVFDSLEKATKMLNEIADNWIADNHYEDRRDDVQITKVTNAVVIWANNYSYYEKISITPMKVE